MRSLNTLLFAATALFGSALGAKQLPEYQHLYSWAAELSENREIEGPLGTRIGISITG
jgi:hypothetical protein